MCHLLLAGSAATAALLAGHGMVLGEPALLGTVVMAAGTRPIPLPPAGAAGAGRLALHRFAFALGGYLMFGLGYIGYMTFNITLLREQGMASGGVTLFYLVLGSGVVASSWLWAGLLQRHRGGVPMAVLNALLALATALPVLSAAAAAAFTIVFALGQIVGPPLVGWVADGPGGLNAGFAGSAAALALGALLAWRQQPLAAAPR